jgi:NADH-quinone oxidoreductase subunit E
MNPKPQAVDQLVDESRIIEVVEEAIREHGAGRDAVVPVMSAINKTFGYIPRQALPIIRHRIHEPDEGVFLADSHLYSVASFYQMFSLHPLGRHVVRFCESAPCHVEGGRQDFLALQEHLGIKPGETSEDNKWSLIMTSCLGICSVGPVFLVDEDVHGNVTPERVPEILARYE